MLNIICLSSFLSLWPAALRSFQVVDRKSTGNLRGPFGFASAVQIPPSAFEWMKKCRETQDKFQFLTETGGKKEGSTKCEHRSFKASLRASAGHRRSSQWSSWQVEENPPPRHMQAKNYAKLPHLGPNTLQHLHYYRRFTQKIIQQTRIRLPKQQK